VLGAVEDARDAEDAQPRERRHLGGRVRARVRARVRVRVGGGVRVRVRVRVRARHLDSTREQG